MNKYKKLSINSDKHLKNLLVGKGKFKGLAPKTYKSSKPDYKGFLNKLGGKR